MRCSRPDTSRIAGSVRHSRRLSASHRGRTAEGDCIRLAWLDTPMGPMVAGATDGGICLLEFTDRRMLEHQFVTLKRRFKAGLAPGRHAHLTTLRSELGEYFAGKRQVFDVPVDMRGTPFQMSVWRELREIPYGETRSYADMARRVGSPAAVRAVGTPTVSTRSPSSFPVTAW